MAQSATHNWKKGKPAFWDQLKARFHLAIQRPATMKKGPVHGFMIPMQNRMERRLRDWGRLWNIRQDNNPQPRTSLSQEAKAQELPPLSQWTRCSIHPAPAQHSFTGLEPASQTLPEHGGRC